MKIVPPIGSDSHGETDVDAFLKTLRDSIVTQTEQGGDNNIVANEAVVSESDGVDIGDAVQVPPRGRLPFRGAGIPRAASPRGGLSKKREESVKRKKDNAARVGSRRHRRWANKAYLVPTAEDLAMEHEPMQTPPSHFTKLLRSNLETWSEIEHGWDGSDENMRFNSLEKEAMCSTGIDKIHRRLRVFLRRGGVRSSVETIETSLRNTFDNDSAALYIVKEPNSFRRLLIHTVCQYLGLTGNSSTVDGERITEITCCSDYSPPETPLWTLLRS